MREESGSQARSAMSGCEMLHVLHDQDDSNGRLAAALIRCIVAQIKETFPLRAFQKYNLYDLASFKRRVREGGEIDALECTTASTTMWY